jgi:hypothetical protein
MSNVKDCAYRVDPVLWVRKVQGIKPSGWQQQFLQAPRGASILALTARQVGKTTAACWAMARTAIYRPGSLSVVACPAQRQSAEAIRRVRDNLLKAGASLTSDNVYGLELDNGSRVLALPGTDDSVRGLTVDGWIVADEAARLSEDMVAALRPMRARKPHARLAMLSTAWSRSDPFWQAWDGEDPSWIRLRAWQASSLIPPFSKVSGSTSARTSTSANIWAFQRAAAQAPSPGSSTSRQPGTARLWSRQGRPSRRQTSPPGYLHPIRSNALNTQESDDERPIRPRRSENLAALQPADHRA